MSTTSLESVQIGDAVLYQTLKDEVVLLNMSNQQYYGLNDIGSRMWELLLELPNVSAVAERLTVEFEVDETSVRADLNGLIERLLNAGLLKTAGQEVVATAHSR
jgi:hypothetical protein